MFNFLFDAGNYEQRKVDRYENGDLIVDTCAASDSSFPFETGVQHPAYNDGSWVIVENYNDREAAQAGHLRWVTTMTADTLPEKLDDVSGAGIAQLLRSLTDDDDE